jgi:hypothetical protein
MAKKNINFSFRGLAVVQTFQIATCPLLEGSGLGVTYEALKK